MAAMRILGIDPGTHVVGFGCLDMPGACAPGRGGPIALQTGNTIRLGSQRQPTLVDCGVLRLGGRHCVLADRLLALCDQLRVLLERLQPDELAIEEAFYGKSVQAALRIGEARGVILAEGARARLAIHQYAPACIKRRVSGSGAASKESVAAMVARQTRLPADWAALPADALDALAAALTRCEERQSPLLRLQAAEGPLGSPVLRRRHRR